MKQRTIDHEHKPNAALVVTVEKMLFNAAYQEQLQSAAESETFTLHRV
jgi:hypothetical protein